MHVRHNCVDSETTTSKSTCEHCSHNGHVVEHYRALQASTIHPHAVRWRRVCVIRSLNKQLLSRRRAPAQDTAARVQGQVPLTVLHEHLLDPVHVHDGRLARRPGKDGGRYDYMGNNKNSREKLDPSICNYL
jgi:hypothetical protein